MTCEGCKNRIPIPGNCHIGCKNVSAKAQIKRWPGSGIWPLTFDERIVIECSGKNQDCVELPTDPLRELARLML